jgi:EAL domain-containing protein (putative c-di-GMP-specific phosphodiesterase class I)
MQQKDSFTKADIKEALELKQFEVYYQPIINKEKNCVISGEALVRWNHPRLGLLHPMSFIPVAEQTGTIFELGEYVLREACIQSKRWKDEGYPFFKVTVNLSLAQLSDMKFPSRVKQITQETGMNPADLELEVTESMAMIDPDVTRHTLLELKEAGIRIMLDDFGAGYSSLSHLRHFPVDGLKIDGQFIRHSLKSERDSKLMHSIILLARSLDLHIIAEGVETEEQLNLLKQMECYNIQGFYFTHALPHNEYKEWCTYFTEHPALQM